MRARCDALRLPVVRGHGDLKPSNVMRSTRRAAEVTFIDFELAGCHYRGYDLFKLFRTNGRRSPDNMRTFLRSYLSCRHTHAAAAGVTPAHAASPAASAASTTPAEGALAALELDELLAEANAAEPLTWLEAAIFFLFATCVYPSRARPLTLPPRPVAHRAGSTCQRRTSRRSPRRA